MTNSNQTSTYLESMELINDSSALIRLNQMFEALLTAHKIDDKMLFYLNLIGDELITNIVSYAYEDKREHIIYVQISVTPVEWTLSICDDGQPFNPLERASPDLQLDVEDRPIGGLGIHFVNQIMDVITYERTEHHNKITMTKKRLERVGD
jgi:anti-sigma regulatory factor (Ser/Thr protein kinase)